GRLHDASRSQDAGRHVQRRGSAQRHRPRHRAGSSNAGFYPRHSGDGWLHHERLLGRGAASEGAAGGGFSLGGARGRARSDYPWGRLDQVVCGVPVSCHPFGGEGLHNCINAGVESIEHGVDLDDGEIKMMIQKGIYLVPTLYHYQLDREENEKKYGGHSVAEVSERSFPKAVEQGVKIAFGSGAGPFPHGSQTKEFKYMVKFGMTPVQAILAATTGAAQLMGWQDRVGSLEAGKFADVIAVTGDPTTDITELERVKFVMKGGQVYKNELK